MLRVKQKRTCVSRQQTKKKVRWTCEVGKKVSRLNTAVPFSYSPFSKNNNV